MDCFQMKCEGCKISQKKGGGVNDRGGIIELDEYWTINHYGGEEGFLGWLAMQPKYHRRDIADLTINEASAMGKNIRRVDKALRKIWNNEDKIERVYVCYFHESTFGGRESLYHYDSHKEHLHIHLIPRTIKTGMILRRYSHDGSIRAWSIPEIAIKNITEFEQLGYQKDNNKCKEFMQKLGEELGCTNQELT